MSDTPDEDRLMADAYHRLLPGAGKCEDVQIIAFLRGWKAGRDWAREQARLQDVSRRLFGEGEP